ncbi:helix-turn-helix domain-containing protein [Desulfosporosinus sp. Sb-LF]|uniref:helix-turn-helix domain-containing protein n=1 Tax=Desulfosporosinus sp. Sb-LF TaxID=2560027 RepID=UPI00107F3C84|nr:helix-turn-helix domain-containing protein [Desulfosporosinus sp. Sb-LF]TGE32251.1 helix-turn-helix domain-containing protein [Desulfosporosinus sp. Sb-LF]
MAGEGIMLRVAREEKEWSLTYTEEITKIRVRYIQALEAEEYGVLPGTTYAKGYLRTYAKQLGLNPDEIIALFNESITSEPALVLEKSQMVVKSRPLWFRPTIIGSLAIVIIAFVIVIAGLNSRGQKIADTPYTMPPLPSAPQTETATSKPTTPTSTPTPTPSAPVTESTPQNVIAATMDGLTAQLVFTQPCWVVVQVDGHPSLQGTFSSGSSKEIKGTSKIELVTVGNAGGLSVTLNGRPYPSLGKEGQVVHNVVLTPDVLKSL